MDVVDSRGRRYYLKVVDARLTALQIDDNKITEQDLPNYQPLLNQVNQAAREARMYKLASLNDSSPINGKTNHVSGKHKDNDQKEIDRELVQIEKDKLRNKKRNLSAQAEMLADEQRGKRHKANNDSLITGTQNPQKHRQASVNIAADRVRVQGVIATLVQEKVVDDVSAVNWFALTDDELVVNGEKQPAALHQKLKDAYAIKPRFGLYYGTGNISGPGIHVDKNDLQ